MRTLIAKGGTPVMVDDEDFDMLSKHKWRIDRYGYARTSIMRSITVLLHRMVLGIKAGDVVPVDHIDGNPLNNTKANLRICTHTQNMCNRDLQANNKSGFKGVVYLKKHGNWQAQIGFKRKTYYLGVFQSPEEAHKAYCEAAARLHGEYANFGAKTGSTGEPNHG